MQNRLLLNWNVSTLELGIRNWELGISVSYFLFPVSLFFFMHVYKVVRQKVCKLIRWNWEMGISIFCFLFSVSRFPFLLYARLQSCKLESYKLFFKDLRYLIKPLARLHVRPLGVGIGNWEMGIGNFYFLFSVSRFPFPFPSFPSLCALTRLHIDTFTCQNWELGISVFRFLFS